MQPMPSPELVMLVHGELIDSELRRYRHWQDDRPVPRSRNLVRWMRHRLGAMLVGLGERIDPTTAQYPRPKVG